MSPPLPASRIVIASPRPTAPTPAAGLTVLGLLGCARRRWKQALLLGSVLAAIAASAVWMYLPPARPYAVTKLYFPSRPPGSVEHPDPPVNQQTQKELITSRLVVKAVFEDPEVAALPGVAEKPDPASWLIREMAIDFPNNSEIMKLTLTDDHPEDAKKVLEKLAQVYTTSMARDVLADRAVNLKRLQDMVATAEKDLEREMYDSKAASAGGMSTSNPEFVAKRLQFLESEAMDARNEAKKVAALLVAARSDEQALAKRLEQTPVQLTKGEFDPLFAQNPQANRVKQSRDDLATEYELKSAGLGPNNPSMVALKNRIDTLDARLESLRKDLYATIAASYSEKLTEERRKKKEEIARLEAEEKAKVAIVTDRQAEAEKLKEGTTTAARFKPAMTATQTILQERRARLQKLEAELAAPVAARQVDGEATIVRPNDASRRIKMAGVAGIAAFGFVVCALGFLEFRAFRVASPVDVSQTLGLRLVGTVPAAPPGLRYGMGSAEWESVLNEAVDSARTLFLHSSGIQNLRRVMVSSAVGGEGKTSLSVRLAASLARAGRRTLLVDADIRNPSVHSHLGLTAGPGVSEVLRGETTVAGCIVPTKYERLSVLMAGNGDRKAVEALAQDEFTRVLAEADHLGFDFVLIDACPILPVADALLVGRNVDGVLLSLLADVSQVDRVNAACQKLAAIDVPLLGAVVSGVRGDVYGYGPRYVTALT
jgi:polysaccharide biosynthesis transport protein